MKRSIKSKGRAKKSAPKKKPAKKSAVKRVSQKSPHSSTRKKSGKFANKGIIVNKNASVNSAEFIRDNVLLVTFNDGHKQQVDFSNFLNDQSTPEYMREYKNASKFKDFKIEDGNVVWGDDWDLIFPIPQLYTGKIK